MGASFYGHKPLFHIHDRRVRIEREKFGIPHLAEIP